MASPLILRVPNQISELTGIIESIEDYLSAQGIEPGTISRLGLITDELFNNTVSYGFPEGGDHEINLEVSVDADNIRLIINDDGVAFNPLAREAPDTTAGLEQRAIGGLGLHLVRNMARKIHYRHQDGRNVITVWLARQAGERAASSRSLD